MVMQRGGVESDPFSPNQMQILVGRMRTFDWAHLSCSPAHLEGCTPARLAVLECSRLLSRALHDHYKDVSPWLTNTQHRVLLFAYLHSLFLDTGALYAKSSARYAHGQAKRAVKEGLAGVDHEEAAVVVGRLEAFASDLYT